MTATRTQKLKAAETDLRELVSSINRLAEGRGDNYASLTLTPGAATTTLANQFLSENSTLALSPRTANAAAALGTTYVSAKANGSVTLTHANNAQTDRIFDVAWIG